MEDSSRVQTISNQPSFLLETRSVNLAVTRQGGHLAPVEFRGAQGDQQVIQPYSISPWWNEELSEDIPVILKVLRGDFFCMPFGGNTAPFKGESHPIHGEVACNEWTDPQWIEGKIGVAFEASMQTHVRPGTVRKRVGLVEGHETVYCQHRIEGMEGPMPLGHHPCVKFPDTPGSGLISFSPFVHGQVFVEPVETPETQGRSSLKPGAVFTSLDQAPLAEGGMTDLSRYPARKGYEDIAMVITDPTLSVGWTAVAFPNKGYIWFALKDPKVLAGTVIWMSNGGRDAAPWNGRHFSVMGLEDVTSYFAVGLAESAGDNPLSQRGFHTTVTLQKDQPFVVNYIMGVARAPQGFGPVREILTDENEIILTDEKRQQVRTPVAVHFLSDGNIETLIGV